MVEYREKEGAGEGEAPTILVVDDAAFMRLRCVKLLREVGFTTIEAENGQQAVDLYRALRPTAVLLDITMPVMDGLTALRSIRAYDPTARVAMVTALGQQEMVLEALKAGACDFVVKPFDARRVVEAAHKLLR